MNVLVIAVHPHMEQSRINKRWLEELKQHRTVTIHDLYAAYPDERIDVGQEQARLEACDRIVLQFPFYWYSSPPLLKKWLDDVLTYGWAYGSSGDKLHGKQFALAVSTGSPEEAYQAGGRNQFSMSELLKPFQATSNLIGTVFIPPFVLHGIHALSEEELSLNAKRYADYVLQPM
ncbi:General stress protein 14 [Paenibacillus konkukensis]|uniref:General stress protein 14 n=1 Tax=Paenibacillus konkukensis TaxID=2020716 RepID=A0ABY4RNW4_9BACL|nr:NAD(P)H-dependent oxidoreductase [Paenibacillus konkukensis]UQZ84141.1 General stress protein 14 [Paenibacillus konkukensis]